MADTVPGLTPAQQAGERAARNTIVRAIAEVVGKLATFVLFAAMARELGQSDLGVFVFAFAFLQVAMMPIDLGFENYLVRRVAQERSALHDLFFNVLAFRLTFALPVVALSFLLVSLLGYDEQTRETVYVLAGGLLIDVLGRTAFGVFIAFERGGLIAASVIVQRLGTAALGLLALAAGYGVVAVAATYTVGAALGLLVSAVALVRSIGTPHFSVAARGWRRLAVSSLPFGAQDMFTILLWKVDAVILSLMASEAAVGRYGAAYRLFESTFFLNYSLAAAFAAMYTYLDADTTPSIQSVFQRSLKLALVILVPCAVTFGLLAEPLSRLVFGADFEAVSHPLRLLAPAVVLVGVTILASSLVVFRGNPNTMVWVTGVVVALNVGLNVALVPSLEDSGAAAAMLVTEAAFAAIVITIATRRVGGLRWAPTLAAPLLAGAAMAVPMVLLDDALLAFGCGITVYAMVFLALERAISPLDLEFALDMVRRRLPSRAAG